VKTRKHILTFFLLTLFLIFLKSDFRIINELRCCQDDFDYYSHALTIAQDFDLDYDNQITSKARFFNESSQKVAPMGFFGSGLLASPFLFLGVVLDNILNIEQEFLNYKKLMYSFSSIFYLFISSILLHKTLVNSEKKFSINLALFGSGIIYFAFERYSMTHAYEVFTVSLVIYFSDKFYRQDSKNKLYSILLPIAILLGFLVRWTNYYIVLIPLIISYFIKYKKHKEKLDIYLIVSTIFSILIFALHTKAIYGYVTFSPLDIYGLGAQKAGDVVFDNIFNNFFQIIFEFIKDIFILLFTFEFGLFWFSPIIFLGFLVAIYKFIFSEIKEKLLFFLVLLCYAQCFFVISIWNSTASSYGFRYTFSLIPLSIYLVYKIEFNYFQKYINSYIFLFSIFSIFSVLFFETTLQTQLSLEPVLNSFGIQKIYSQPDYLIGVIKSFFNVESYLKIGATSFLGAIFLKLIILFFGYDRVLLLIENLGFGNNSDLMELIYKINTIESQIFVTTILISIIAIQMLVKNLNKS